MRSTLLVPALLGLAAAIPHESPMDGGLAAMEAPVSLNKRATFDYTKYCQYVINWWVCQRLPTSKYSGNSSVSPDTATAFKANGTFIQISNNAITPTNYMQSFQNMDGATSTSNYLGYYEFATYNTTMCAAKCDATKKCTAFNIFFERDPITTTDQYCCPNPASVTRIKCSLWGTDTTATTANNKGQMRDSFQVAIAGSNGYNKQMVFSSSSSSTTKPSTSATTGKSSVPTTALTTSSSGSSPKSSAASVKSSGLASGGGAVGANAGPSSTNSPGVSVAPNGGGSNAPSVTTSPSLSSSAPPLSGLAVSSQSASVASADAAQPVTDPGSPVTASIATSATPCSTPVASPQVNFNLNRTTDGTQTIYIYGGIDQLGEWNVDDAVKMSFFDIPGPQKNWFVAVNFTAGTYFEYKYFQRNQDWSITWPDPANRVYTVPTGCQQSVVINDAWPS